MRKKIIEFLANHPNFAYKYGNFLSDLSVEEWENIIISQPVLKREALKHLNGAVLFAEDRIGMMRTIKRVPPIFTDEEFAAIAAEHFIFDGAQVNNISSDYASVLSGGMEKKRARIAELRAKQAAGSQ